MVWVVGSGRVPLVGCSTRRISLVEHRSSYQDSRARAMFMRSSGRSIDLEWMDCHSGIQGMMVSSRSGCIRLRAIWMVVVVVVMAVASSRS